MIHTFRNRTIYPRWGLSLLRKTMLRNLRPFSALMGIAFSLGFTGLSLAAQEPDAGADPDATEAKAAEDLPFPPGEKLTYEIRWSIFPVGTATLEFLGPVEFNGEEAYKIILTARTNSFADGFFKVRNYNASWVDAQFTKPLHYIKLQNEGKERREVVVTFDWDQNKAQYSDFGNKRDPIDIADGSWDPLSIVYAVRAMRFADVKELDIPTTDGKKLMMTEIDVKGTDRIRVPAGTFETLVVVPDTKDLGGVFKKSDNAGITFWFSNDDRHLPVRMSSSVAVGSFVAELVKVEGPGSEDYEVEASSGPERRGPRR